MTDWNSFKGRAKRLDDIDLPKLGHLIGVGEDELHAFLDVETRGSGFDPQGRPRILFERHIFHKELSSFKDKTLLSRAVSAGLASTTPGGYGPESGQYAKLAKAMRIHPVAALRSCSWGLGQVMGFNHELAGYDTVEAMVLAFMDDEENHLRAAVDFIKNTRLDDELRGHKWAAFAKGYNGPGYQRNRYDEKLANAFAKWKRVKDTPWTPGDLHAANERAAKAEADAEKAKHVVKDAAAEDRVSTTEVVTGIGGVTGVVTAAKEAVDATKESVNTLQDAGPWVVVAILLAGFAIYVIRERRRKKAIAREVLA